MIYGTGIDIVDISRFERFVREDNQPLFRRVFTPAEQAYCTAKKRSAQHYALRFAAKEAFVKAMGTGLRDGISWRDMEVVNDPLGKPELKLCGRAEELFRQKNLGRIFLSLSHDGNYAIASVILEGE
ncbi:MAG TPA: holo-[acyl-carrier-protein] synthase [Geobacteraceae bacterium]|nr:holo-[acyl-carrier-protein] synthase [Geobacteraceae bacterium]